MADWIASLGSIGDAQNSIEELAALHGSFERPPLPRRQR